MAEIDDVLAFDPVAIGKKKEAEDEEVSAALGFDPSPAVSSQPTEESTASATDRSSKSELSWSDAISSGINSLPEQFGKYKDALVGAAGQIYDDPSLLYKGPVDFAKGFVQLGMLRMLEAEGVAEIDWEEVRELSPAIGEVEAEEQRFLDLGDEQKLKERISTDLLGVGMDFSTLMQPIAMKMGRAVDPFSLALKIPSKAAGKVLDIIMPEKAHRMLVNAVKFQGKFDLKEQMKFADTALANKVTINRKGMMDLRSKLSELNQEMKGMVDEAAKAGKFSTIDKLYDGMDTLQKDMKRYVDANEWDEVVGVFAKTKAGIAKIKAEVGPLRGPKEIQMFKQRIYKQLQSAYDGMMALPARNEIRMMAASNARKAIESMVPEVKDFWQLGPTRFKKKWLGMDPKRGAKAINEIEGDLIELQEAVHNRANVIDNATMVGMGALAPGSAGGIVGAGVGHLVGDVAMYAGAGTGIGFAYGIINSSPVKTKLAQALYTFQKHGITPSPTKAALHLGVYQTAKSMEKTEAE